MITHLSAVFPERFVHKWTGSGGTNLKFDGILKRILHHSLDNIESANVSTMLSYSMPFFFLFFFFNEYLCLPIGGIPGDHLIVPVSDHSIPSPMHLRLGQKERVWSGEDDVDEDRMGQINAEDADDEFEGGCWEENEEDEEEEVEEDEDEEQAAVVDWDMADFPPQSTQHYQHANFGVSQKDEDVRTEEDAAAPIPQTGTRRQTSESHLHRFWALQRTRSRRRHRFHGVLGSRLSQHWKNWRQRAQRVYSLGLRWGLKGQMYNCYSKPRRIKGYRPTLYTDDDISDDERFTEAGRGTEIR